MKKKSYWLTTCIYCILIIFILIFGHIPFIEETETYLLNVKMEKTCLDHCASLTRRHIEKYSVLDYSYNFTESECHCIVQFRRGFLQ